MLVTLAGMLTSVNEHLEKAPSPMAFVTSDILTAVRSSQPPKAQSPTSVTVERFATPSSALSPAKVTLRRFEQL